jgi:branched-chain amino acid aminotransferase
MKKLFIRQSQFSPLSSRMEETTLSFTGAGLPPAYLNKISVFETLRSYGGKIFRLEEHLERLSESCRGVSCSLPLESAAMGRWIEGRSRESGLKDAVLRFSVHWISESQGIFVIIIREFRSCPAEWYRKGIGLRTVVSRRWTLRAQDAQIKGSQYVSGVLAHLDQKNPKPHELVFLGQGGYLAEGTVSNLFLVKRKSLLTPSVASGILRGVTRGFVIELAQKRRLKIDEAALTRHELYNADECFITNTSSEILPAVSVDGRPIGNGRPGPISQSLLRDFRRHVRSKNED